MSNSKLNPEMENRISEIQELFDNSFGDKKRLIKTLAIELYEAKKNTRQENWMPAGEFPDDQAEWWWWNEDLDSPAILVFILYSETDDRYFASVGQHGWNVFQWVDDMGGRWMKAEIPVPQTPNNKSKSE